MLGLRLPENWRSAMYGMKNTFVRNCSSNNHLPEHSTPVHICCCIGGPG